MSVTLHTQTPPPAVTGPGPGPCVPPRCPTAGTSVARWFRWHGVSEPGLGASKLFQRLLGHMAAAAAKFRPVFSI